MEDILSSIRTTMAEEGAKVGSGSADLIDAAAAQDGEEDVLELSEADMIAAPAKPEDEDEGLIDIAAFTSTGEAKAVEDTAAVAVDIADAQPAAAEVNVEEAADEFDRLLAEISQEQQKQVVAAEVSKQALMDEEDPLGAEGEIEEAGVDEPVALEQAVEAAAMAELTNTVAGAAQGYSLGMVDGPNGVQVAFPAEVLAMALRPMVQEWLTKNLPGVVEKLVKEEISKLTQN